MADKAHLVDAFIEAFDARNREAAADTVASGHEQLFEELQQGSPWTSLVRADLEGDPVAVIWVPDEQGVTPDAVGYVSFETSGDGIDDAHVHYALPDGLQQKVDAGTLVATEPGRDPAE